MLRRRLSPACEFGGVVSGAGLRNQSCTEVETDKSIQSPTLVLGIHGGISSLALSNGSPDRQLYSRPCYYTWGYLLCAEFGDGLRRSGKPNHIFGMRLWATSSLVLSCIKLYHSYEYTSRPARET